MQSRKKSGESPVQEESRSLCFVEVEVSNIGNIDIGVFSKVNVEYIIQSSRFSLCLYPALYQYLATITILRYLQLVSVMSHSSLM